MPPRIGYLLPTREQIMAGVPGTGALLELAERAAGHGFASLWVGDSLLARPRHEPLTLLAGIAGRLPGITLGTAVLLPALRNPVLLAHQVATLDQLAEGRLILGVGIARDVPDIRAEFTAAGVPFEKRVGRVLEGLRLAQALWRGTPVDWDGRWSLEQGVLAPTPYRVGGPPIWGTGSLPASLERAGRVFDGWLPNGVEPGEWRAQWQEVRRAATAAGRDLDALTGAMYLTLSLDADAGRAAERLDAYLQGYYGQPAAQIRKRQSCYAGTINGAVDWLQAYAAAGVQHMVLRFAGEDPRHLQLLGPVIARLG